MAVVNGYTTAAELRTHLGDSSSLLTLELLERAINAASRAVDRHCRRRFWRDATTAVRTYPVVSPEWLRTDDISTRTGLVVKVGTDGINFSTTLTINSDFVLEPANADVAAAGDTADPHAFWLLTAVGGHSFTTGRRYPTVQVTARFGWNAVPYEVNEATILKAASLLKRKEAPFGVAGFGDFGAVRIKDDPDVIGLLEPFRKLLVG